ncbi:hypothetical protein [uncultured Mycolicibacterium sp.]|uniref:hypothetical protein n=1 Tax=uncultured Mycolicibacterium sp. TaxID=2320817 RepID=UPI0026282175|nr:hypothetical protein [uncultured Mycolicibacterium sp.]
MGDRTWPVPTKLAAAIVAAGMATAGTELVTPTPSDHAVRAVAVAPAGVVTDLLYAVGEIPTLIARTAATMVSAGLTLPLDVVSAVVISAERPELAPSVWSWLIQRYANPSEDHYLNHNDYGDERDPQPWFSYARELAGYTERLIAGLPVIGASAADLLDAVTEQIGAALSAALPDPDAGGLAVAAFHGTDLGGFLESLDFAATMIPTAVAALVSYVAHLPADLSAVVEVALRDPGAIPGLVSWLLHGVLDAGVLTGKTGLLGVVFVSVVFPVFSVLSRLPRPLGDIAAWAAIVPSLALVPGLWLLSHLPEPVNPHLVLSGTAGPGVFTVKLNRSAGDAHRTVEPEPAATTPEESGTGPSGSDGAAGPGPAGAEPAEEAPSEEVPAEAVPDGPKPDGPEPDGLQIAGTDTGAAEDERGGPDGAEPGVPVDPPAEDAAGPDRPARAVPGRAGKAVGTQRPGATGPEPVSAAAPDGAPGPGDRAVHRSGGPARR